MKTKINNDTPDAKFPTICSWKTPLRKTQTHLGWGKPYGENPQKLTCWSGRCRCFRV